VNKKSRRHDEQSNGGAANGSVRDHACCRGLGSLQCSRSRAVRRREPRRAAGFSAGLDAARRQRVRGSKSCSPPLLGLPTRLIPACRSRACVHSCIVRITYLGICIWCTYAFRPASRALSRFSRWINFLASFVPSQGPSHRQ